MALQTKWVVVQMDTAPSEDGLTRLDQRSIQSRRERGRHDINRRDRIEGLKFDSWKQSSCLLIEQKLSEYVIFKFIHSPSN